MVSMRVRNWRQCLWPLGSRTSGASSSGTFGRRFKPRISDSEGSLSCLGFVQPRSGRTVLESKGTVPLTDERMLAAKKRMSNKFLHFPQHIDFIRKKTSLTRFRTWKPESIDLILRLTREKASGF